MVTSPKRARSPVNLLLAVGLLLMAACTPAGSQLESDVLTDTPSPTVVVTPSATPFVPPAGYVEYLARSGDTLDVVAIHFGVQPAQVRSDKPIPAQGLLDPGQKLYLPPFNRAATPAANLFPDSEVVFSPSASKFDMAVYVDGTDGKLKKHIDDLTQKTGVQVLQQFALEYSVNPRLLLTLLEFNGNWLSGNPQTREQSLYSFGYVKTGKGGLYDQVNWVCRVLNNGYYGWRSGTLTELDFPDGSRLRLAPSLNAGTVAVMHYLSKIKSQGEFTDSLARLAQVHQDLFGDPLVRAAKVEPLLPAGLKQPELSLPFPTGYTWNYTCGPHASWGYEGDLPFGALDFAPPAAATGCGNSVHWATAMASGTILSRPVPTPGLVIQELDGDGDEHTGWVLFYMHIAGTGRVQPDTRVQVGDRIGHPSCEGGSSSGIHVHVHRAYNGELISAVGGLPFVLSGYQAGPCIKPCQDGTLTRGDVTVKSFPWGNYWTKICQPGSERCTMGTPTPRPTLTPTVTRTPRPTLTPTVTRTPTVTPTPSVTIISTP